MKLLFKKATCLLLAGAILGLTAACGGNASAEAVGVQQLSITRQGTSIKAAKAIAALREMMALDYKDMTVADFHQSIQDIAQRENTNIFTMISDAYDIGDAVFDTATYYGKPLDDFMRTTLDYSAAQLFEEPCYLGSVAYIVTTEKSAREMRTLQQTDSAAYHAYLERSYEDIKNYTNVFYSVAFAIKDDTLITVAQRDEKLNACRVELEDFVTSMGESEIGASNIKSILQAKLTELAEKHSDENMQLTATLESYENADTLA